MYRTRRDALPTPRLQLPARKQASRRFVGNAYSSRIPAPVLTLRLSPGTLNAAVFDALRAMLPVPCTTPLPDEQPATSFIRALPVGRPLCYVVEKLKATEVVQADKGQLPGVTRNLATWGRSGRGPSVDRGRPGGCPEMGQQVSVPAIEAEALTKSHGKSRGIEELNLRVARAG